MKEARILAVYAPPALVTAAVAGVLVVVLRRVLARTGFYRLVWHPGLFDVAVFFIVWNGLSRFAETT